jgi:hypothetical protein
MGLSMSVCRVFPWNWATRMTQDNCWNTPLQQWEQKPLLEYIVATGTEVILGHIVTMRTNVTVGSQF